MYVKSIHLENFQSYYGSDNHLEFSEGLNVVVGSINKGKSKLFDAFYWVLFGEIFITGETWMKTESLPMRASFINDRAKYLTQPGEEVHVRVELVICHEEPDELPVDYTFCRTVTASRSDNGANWHEDRAWRVGNSYVELRYRRGHNLEIMDGKDEVEQRRNKLFQPEIRDYVWFQGEALDKLIDFSNRATFERAIRYISYFPRYEKLSNLIEQASAIIEKERNRKQRAATSDKKEYDRVVQDLAKVREDLNRAEIELTQLEDNRTNVREQYDKAEFRLQALKEFPPLEAGKSKAEADLKIARERIDREIDQQKANFQKVWLLKGLSSLMQEAKAQMEDYEQQRNSNTKYVLPAEIPAKFYMEKMLSEQQCLVCGTDAPVDSTPYIYIANRIKAQESYYQQLKDNQELYGSVHEILSFPDEVTATIDGINTQIEETEDCLTKARWQRHQANETVQNIQAQLDSLLHKYQLSDASQATLQINKFSTLSRNLSDLEDRIKKKEQAINGYTNQIKTLETKLNISGTGQTATIPEVRWYELADFMNRVVQNVTKQAKADMIELIEQRANDFYRNIIRHNRSVDGKISIDRSTYRIARTENDEYTVVSGNTGNFTLMKMCIINAMLHLNEQAGGTAYPFVADAPTSNFDDETTIAYLKSLSSAFRQSIIITKDISQFRFVEITGDPGVRTVHILETYSENPSSERLTQYEAYTKIKRIK